MDASEVARMKELVEENNRLKRIVANLTLEMTLLRMRLKKSTAF